MDSLEEQLLEAVDESNIDVVQTLIAKGAHINYVPSRGKSALSTAVVLGNIPLVCLLLNSDKSSNTSVHEELPLTNQKAKSKKKRGLNNDQENQNCCVTYTNSTGNNQSSVKHKQNSGYYEFVHFDNPDDNEGFSEEDVYRNESLDADTPEGMDGLEWDMETEGKGEEPDDVWSSQYRWYADILDKTGGLVADTVHGCDVNLQDSTGRSAAHHAVDYHQLEALHCLISAGCKVDLADADNVTPLHIAAMRDSQEIAKVLIEKGANVNLKTTEKMTPLHFAAVKGFTEMVLLLIKGGAAVDPLDANDRTPLILAVTRNHFDVVKILISNGAKVNIEEIHGYTPLCEAVWNKSVEVANLLLRSGAKLTQSQHLLHYTVLHRHLAMAELLLRYGAYPNLRDDQGDTPLILAITCKHMDMIKLLLKYDANPNYPNSVSGVTPLHKALTIGKQEALFDELLRELCKYKVDLNMPGAGVFPTPLAASLIIGELSCAVSLIRAGADVNKCNISALCQTEGPSIVDLAVAKHAHTLVHLMVAAGFDLSKHNAEFPKDFSKLNMDTIVGWLTYTKYNPRRLTDLCRLKVRSLMGNKVLLVVPNLEIPQSLKRFLLFQDVYVDKFAVPCDNGYRFIRVIRGRI